MIFEANLSDLLEKIRKATSRALNDFGMLSAGNKVMVAVSGGKDSAVLLYILDQIRQRAPFEFSIQPVILDQKQPGFAVEKFQEWVHRATNYELKVLEEDTYSVVVDKTPEGKTFCGLCSRLRRGILYTWAHRHGFDRIALGHHRDDLNHTLLLNMFYTGNIASMPPKLLSDDARNIVIRPFVYVAESMIQQAAELLEIPVIPCNLCGSQDGLKRQRIKKLLGDLRNEIPAIQESLIAAQQNLRPSQLMDDDWHDFENLEIVSSSDLNAQFQLDSSI
jgi:tRNA 2-thiocytidine biosynthesis protein TtcA